MCKSWTGKTQPHSLQTCGHCVRQTSHPTPLTPPWLSSLIPSSSFHGLWLWSILITLSCSDLCDTEPYKFSQHLGHLFSLIFFWNLSPVLQLSPKLCFVGFGRDLNLHQYYSFFPVLFSSHLLLQVWGGQVSLPPVESLILLTNIWLVDLLLFCSGFILSYFPKDLFWKTRPLSTVAPVF